jgi:hypothetical protein
VNLAPSMRLAPQEAICWLMKVMGPMDRAGLWRIIPPTRPL